MNSRHRDSIRRDSIRRDSILQCSRPLEPIATGEAAVLKRLGDIRAVLFDIYGTLLISASGDVGSADESAQAAAFQEALAVIGLTLEGDATAGWRCLRNTIDAMHAAARGEGVDYPEVDIIEVWRATLSSLMQRKQLPDAAAAADLARLAVEYELRANPLWPMPHAAECLAELRQSEMTLGAISNAQFFTPEMVGVLLGRSLEELGFDRELLYFSYRHGRAKPSPWMYELARGALADREIAAGQVLYIGNDLLNDVMPAGRVGFRTALFAGDKRSLRRRGGDARLKGLSPDLVLTDLSQLSQCLEGLPSAAEKS